MLGSKSRKPIVITRSVMIEAPREIVFDLLDFSSPSNVLRACGYEFRENAFGLGRYCATHPDAEGVVYHFEVDDIVPNMVIGFRSWLDTDLANTAVTGSRSDYELFAVGEDRCRLEMVETAAVKPRTGRKALKREEVAMAELVDAHLHRIKLIAEFGTDADADVAA